MIYTYIGIYIVSVLATLFTGHFLLPVLKKVGMSQKERKMGPASHLEKEGTPTMGGIFFLIPFILLSFLFAFIDRTGQNRRSAIVLFAFSVLMGIIGFIDDFVKAKKNAGGLSAFQKTLLMSALCIFVVVYCLYIERGVSGDVLIIWPFGLGETVVPQEWKLLYAIFLVLLVYYTVNAVNFTDGVDGLLSSVSIPVFLSLMVICGKIFPGPEGISAQSALICGGLTGFLVFNRHPAKVFMGDTGSLFVGALYSGIIILSGMPWLLLLNGFIYFFEALSVVIQVTYFKLSHGKRVFKMTPIHHHFELKGYKEKELVCYFTLFSAAFSLLSALSV